ncbi:hypothetical protein GWI33_019080 [Rhynchophorus ferrugineus]|uniref:LITAF domain-containing protein n=1 Tax=Rhynchophorus ferrugineus TaxID=354439 RepID=A0A834HS56_RHYFE|nr:hypothetical protein GWI33_019080 [Rhynchophorus ferrugineus]
MEKELPPPYAPQPVMYPPGAYPPPPQPGYPPPPQAGYPPIGMPTPSVGHTVIVTTTSPAAYGPEPIGVTCPYCHAAITTTVETEPNTKTHLSALLLFVCGCWLCCCIPYCMDSCQSKKHFCPNCKAYLAEYSP